LITEIPSDLLVYRAPCWGAIQSLFDRREPSTFFERIRDWFLRAYGYLLIPDPMVGWVIPAIFESRKIFRAHPDIEVIITSSPPPSVNLIGRMLRKQFQRPWIADFRDAWMSIPDRDQRRLKIDVRDTFEMWLEKYCVRHIDHLITVNRPIVDDWIARYPYLYDRISIITNGFDPDDFKNIKGIQIPKFTLVYTGTFLSGRDPTPFLQALYSLLKDKPELRDEIKVFFVGDNSIRVKKDVISRLGLVDIVTILPYLPRQKALAYQKGADILLLFGTLPTGDPRRDRQNLTGKIFEYMASGRPILAMAPDSVLTDLIHELQLGVAVSPTDPAEIRQAIESFLTQAPTNGFDVTLEPAKLFSFHREELTRQLANILNGMSDVEGNGQLHQGNLKINIRPHD
jgi:glycosyltransferase involved in cell wall biosynthesis